MDEKWHCTIDFNRMCVSERRDRTICSMPHLHLSVALIFIVIAVGVGRCCLLPLQSSSSIFRANSFY